MALQFKDFPAEAVREALAAANFWLEESRVRLVNVETLNPGAPGLAVRVWFLIEPGGADRPW